jgi:hypothetical protein
VFLMMELVNLKSQKLNSMQIYICDYITYKKLTPINLWVGGINKIELKQKLGEPAVLDLEINRDLGFLWNILKNNSNDLAIRLVDPDSNLDIPFVLDQESQVDTPSGTKFTFISFIRSIRNKKPLYSQNTNLSGYAFENIMSLDENIIWEGVGSNIQLNYNIGTKNNFEILQEICKKTGWVYRENGFGGTYINDVNAQKQVYTFLPKILLGDFKVIGPELILTNWADYNISSPIILNEPRVKSKTTSYKYTKLVGTIGDSGSGSSSILLNSQVVVNSTYPTVQININDSFELYINDTTQTQTDYDTITIPLWQGATAQDLYNFGILEIAKRKTEYVYELDILSHRFIQAGTKIQVKYSSKTLPLNFEATVVENLYDYSSKFCKISISESPNVQTLGRNIWQIQKALDTLKEQQTAPR